MIRKFQRGLVKSTGHPRRSILKKLISSTRGELRFLSGKTQPVHDINACKYIGKTKVKSILSLNKKTPSGYLWENIQGSSKKKIRLMSSGLFF